MSAGSITTKNVFQDLVEAPWFGRLVIALIVMNAVVLGLETYTAIFSVYGTVLKKIDHTILWLFVIELGLRLGAYRGRFFRDPWSLFDALVVAVAFMPANEAFSVLRTLRALRILRLISSFPTLRRVVQSFLAALPSIGSIGAILLIVLYMFGIMATKLFGQSFPQWFGSLHVSLFSLFQIMTLEGWPDIVRTIKQVYPYAWVFFVAYILIATFTTLNLFIAVIVDAVQKQHAPEQEDVERTLKLLRDDIGALGQKIDSLAGRK